MKNIKLLFVTGAMALSLVACKPNYGHLPAGGKVLDYKTEAGQKQIREDLDRTVKAYENGIDAISLKAEIRNTSINAKGRVGSEEAPLADIDANIKKVRAKAELNLKKDGEQTIGNLKVSDLGLDFAMKATINGDDKKANLNDKFSCSGVGAQAYLKDNILYADYSGSAFRKALDSASTFVNHINKEIPHKEGEEVVDYDLNKMIDEATGAPGRKIAIPGMGASLDDLFKDFKFEEITDEDFAAAMAYLEKVSFITFKGYNDGRYGAEASITKDVLKDLVLADAESEEKKTKNAEEFERLVKEFKLDVAILFGKDARLSEVSYAASIELNFTDELAGLLPSLKGTNLTLAAKSEGGLKIAYDKDVSVKMLSDSELAKFQVIQPKESEEE